MNKHASNTGPGKQRNWQGAIGYGVLLCVLIFTMLSIALNLFFPEVMDNQAIDTTLLGIAVWVISIGMGIWHGLKRL